MRSGFFQRVVVGALTMACSRGVLHSRNRTLNIEDCAVRALPSHVGALYLRITNNTETADRLTRVESAKVESAQLHEVIRDGTLVSMRPAPVGFDVPAGQTLVLAPGGKHVMLFGVDPRDGHLPITLYFERAGAVAANAEVRSALED